MSYGVRVKNNNGDIQIDAQYQNMGYTEGGTGVTVSNSGSSPGITNIGITVGSKIPLILFRPGTSYFSCITDYISSGGSYSSFNMQTEYKQSDTVDWRCYRQMLINPSGYGLRVRDSSGNLVFHSGNSFFKIKSVNSISLGAPSYGSYPYSDITHSNDSNPYYIISDCGFWVTNYVAISPPGTYGFMLCRIGIKKLSSTSVRVGWFPFAILAIPGIPSGTNAGYNPTIKLIVCEI